MTDRDAFLRFVRRASLAAAPWAGLATRPGCPPLASSTIRLAAFEEHRRTKSDSATLHTTHGHDQRARDPLPRRCCRPVRVSTVLPARRVTPNLRRRSERTLRCATSLYAFSRVSGSRQLVGTSLPRTGQGAAHRVSPTARRSSTEPTTSSRRAVLRRLAAPSWQAT